MTHTFRCIIPALTGRAWNRHDPNDCPFLTPVERAVLHRQSRRVVRWRIRHGRVS